MEKQYRILSPEEIIQEGDEFQCAICTGWHKATSFGKEVGTFRVDKFRRPIPAKSATDPDESFQEIKILGEEVEMWKKLCRENDADLVAMKLRAEKAEAARDGAKKLITKLQQDKSQAERERDEAIKTRQEVEQRLLHAETELAEIYMAFGYPDPSDSEDIGPSDVREVVVKERDTLRAELSETEAGFTNICKHVEKSLPYTGCHSILEHIDNAADEIRRLREALEKIHREATLIGREAYSSLVDIRSIAQSALAGKGEK